MKSRFIDFLKIELPFLYLVLKRIFYWFQRMRSTIKIKNLLRRKKEIYVELGAGIKKGQNGWVTVDMEVSCDLYWDLREGLPFPDGSLSKIYSAHFFEHLTYQEGQQLFSRCFNALKPGGIFLICVPNARLFIEKYMHSEAETVENMFGHEPAYNHTTRIDSVNYMAYMDGHHKYMFDEENLLHILKRVGFLEVSLRDFDANLDPSAHRYFSIYAEAHKSL